MYSAKRQDARCRKLARNSVFANAQERLTRKTIEHHRRRINALQCQFKDSNVLDAEGQRLLRIQDEEYARQRKQQLEEATHATTKMGQALARKVSLPAIQLGRRVSLKAEDIGRRLSIGAEHITGRRLSLSSGSSPGLRRGFSQGLSRGLSLGNNALEKIQRRMSLDGGVSVRRSSFQMRRKVRGKEKCILTGGLPPLELIGNIYVSKHSSDHDDNFYGSIRDEAYETWRQNIIIFLDEPSSSWSARLFSFLTIALIGASALSLLFGPGTSESRSSCTSGYTAWTAIEWIACDVFTLETIARLAAAHRRQSFIHICMDPYIIFDILAILPCWLVPLLSGVFLRSGTDGVSSPNDCHKYMYLKVLRVFRLMKLTRKYEGSIVIARALKKSGPPLTVAFFFLMISMFVLSTCLYFAEQMSSSNAFYSILHAMWFLVVTMTTVGFGDVTPLSVPGKIVTTASMLFGVLFLSMPLAIVGNNFCLVWEDKERVIFVEKLREQLRFQKRQFKALVETFEMMDVDGSDLISFREFKQALRRMNIRISSDHLKKLWRTLEVDEAGEVELTEFLMLVFKDDPIALDAALHRFGDSYYDDDGETFDLLPLTDRSSMDDVNALSTESTITDALQSALNSLHNFRTTQEELTRSAITTKSNASFEAFKEGDACERFSSTGS